MLTLIKTGFPLASLLVGCALLAGCERPPESLASSGTEPQPAESGDAPMMVKKDLPAAGAVPMMVKKDIPAAGEAEQAADQPKMTREQIEQKIQMLTAQGMSPREVSRRIIALTGDRTSTFKDEVESNEKLPKKIGDLVFYRSDQDDRFELKRLFGKYNLVLVFTRGYYQGTICPFCSTQTAQLASKREEFEERDAKVLVVYPGSGEHLPDFTRAVAEEAAGLGLNPQQAEAQRWPVVLDKDLLAVNLLNITDKLAFPSTFIVDKRGQVVFAYVGKNPWDRPSARALLKQLDALQAGGAQSNGAATDEASASLSNE